MMTASQVETWQLRKPAVHGTRGLVASQHHRASAVGAEVLADGGNAVDAAVATGLAIATQEPWMSGLGGGGFMLVYETARQRVQAVDFAMVAPRALDPANYPLVPGRGADLFNWPAVLEDRNLLGYPAMAAPGQVAGLALALETFGSRPWGELLAPAIALARKGLSVDWYATLKIAAAARDLTRFPASRESYLPDGFVPAGQWGSPPPVIHLGKLADTLEQLAAAGPEDFYHGDLAASLAADLAAGGSPLGREDLATYRARLLAVSEGRYRDARIHYTPGLSAGPSLRHALSALEQHWHPGERPDAEAFGAYARALQGAYRKRLESLGAGNDPDPACTTHISVVDRAGNLVALTQTLLSVFGSKTVLPGSGILMNNGIMWFDPRPGRPNSLAPGRRPLANMCPTLLELPGARRLALGASGGRRIMPALCQLISFLVDFGMDLDEAFHQPRIDVSGTDTVVLDTALEADIRAALNADFDTLSGPHGVYPNLFACPNGVLIDPLGQQTGAAFIPSPWANVAHAGEAP